MRFLLDMPVSRVLIEVLQRHGHEGVHVQDLGLGRSPDSELLATARREAAVVITADLDFPRLLVLSLSEGPGVILFRGGNYSDQEMAALLGQVLETVAPDVLARSVCVVDKRHVRITQLPIHGRD